MSMSKPLARTWRPPLPRPAKGVAEKQHAGLPELDAQPSVADIRLPEGAAPKVSAPVQVRRAHIRTPAQHASPSQQPGRILIPGDGAAGDQGPQNRPACAAIAAMQRVRPVPSQRFLALWCQAHTPSCSRQVTSTSIRMARPGPASVPRGHAPLRTDILSLARTISDRRFRAQDEQVSTAVRTRTERSTMRDGGFRGKLEAKHPDRRISRVV